MSCQNCGRIGKCSTCCCNHVDHDAYPHRPCRRCEHSLTGGFDAEVIAREASDRGEDVLAAVIFQALGAASACWDNLAGAGVFESERAEAIGDDLLAYLRRRRLTGEAHQITDKGKAAL